MKSRKLTIDWEIIQKMADGTISATEETELKAWTNENAERGKLVANALEYCKQHHIPGYDQGRVDNAWSMVGRKMDGGRKLRRRPARIVGWAAAAAVIAAFAASIWLRGGMPEMLGPDHAVVPGSSMISLTLSDGTQKMLSNNGASEHFSDGGADIRKTGDVLEYPSTSDVPVGINTISIPSGEMFQVALNDGTRVWLNTGTRMEFPVVFGEGERRVRLWGEAYFEVRHDPQRPFIVETGAFDIKVLGTSFNVSAYSDEALLRTTLIEGSVELLSGGKQLALLSPSSQAVYSVESGKVEVGNVSPDMWMEWIHNRFVFRDNTLREIMTIISRWYGVDYEFSDDLLAEERFYGTMGRHEKIGEILSLFERTSKVRFEYVGNKIVIK